MSTTVKVSYGEFEAMIERGEFEHEGVILVYELTEMTPLYGSKPRRTDAKTAPAMRRGLGAGPRKLKITSTQNHLLLIRRSGEFTGRRLPHHAATWNRAPTPAVTPIASAPQNVTRTAPTQMGAPPTLAASAPRTERIHSVARTTEVIV